MREILKSITSTDREVLLQSLQFTQLRAAQEIERGKAAEARATAMLAVLAILAGLIVPLVESATDEPGDRRWFLLATFLASLLFLMRGLLYAIKVLGVYKQYRLKPETIFDFQSLSAEEALREEIAATIWETNRVSDANTPRLFWLDRCQRSDLVAIFLFIGFGFALVAVKQLEMSPPVWLSIVIVAVSIAALVAADIIIESYNIWRKGSPLASTAIGDKTSGRHTDA